MMSMQFPGLPIHPTIPAPFLRPSPSLHHVFRTRLLSPPHFPAPLLHPFTFFPGPTYYPRPIPSPHFQDPPTIPASLLHPFTFSPPHLLSRPSFPLPHPSHFPPHLLFPPFTSPLFTAPPTIPALHLAPISHPGNYPRHLSLSLLPSPVTIPLLPSPVTIPYFLSQLLFPPFTSLFPANPQFPISRSTYSHCPLLPPLILPLFPRPSFYPRPTHVP